MTLSVTGESRGLVEREGDGHPVRNAIGDLRMPQSSLFGYW